MGRAPRMLVEGTPAQQRRILFCAPRVLDSALGEEHRTGPQVMDLFSLPYHVLSWDSVQGVKERSPQL